MTKSVFHHFTRTKTSITRCLLLSMLVALVGCTRQPAEFSHRDDYADLMPDAQQYVDRVLTAYFGEPTKIVAWERLPLKLHAAVGTAGAGSTPEIVPVNYTERNLSIEPGMQAVWMSGRLLESSDVGNWVEALDDAGNLVFRPSLSSVPSEGDRVAVGPGDVLKSGRVLYAEHCMHCHGVTGDAKGPTAPYLSPKPRDFRRGIFKFTTTNATSRAQRADLARTIEEGIPGTYMPSFKLLKKEESLALVEYVLWLSMRGEIEYQLVGMLKNEYSKDAVKDRMEAGETRQQIIDELVKAVNGTDMPEQLNDIVDTLAGRWTESQEESAVIVPSIKRPEANAESIARGRQLYLSKDLNCIACHGESGLGDGVQTYSITKNSAGEDNPLPGLFDEWGNPIKPRNLAQGIYRGGRRPIDLFCRLHGGIKGTPMPAFGGKKTDQELWDVVNYIYSVPFEHRVAGDGANEPRPQPEPEKVAAIDSPAAAGASAQFAAGTN